MPARWRQYLDERKEADLARVASYKNSKGEAWSSRPDDILMHVIMHSGYHRGQIASDMRTAGLTPAYTDFHPWCAAGAYKMSLPCQQIQATCHFW
jgi:uncharacterized damage-inducible protein DinB